MRPAGGVGTLFGGLWLGWGNIPVGGLGPRCIQRGICSPARACRPAQQTKPQVIDDGGGVVVMIPDQGGMGHGRSSRSPVDRSQRRNQMVLCASSAPQSSGRRSATGRASLDGPVPVIVTVSR